MQRARAERGGEEVLELELRASEGWREGWENGLMVKQIFGKQYGL